MDLYFMVKENGDIASRYFATKKSDNSVKYNDGDPDITQDDYGNWSHKRIDGKWVEIDNTNALLEEKKKELIIQIKFKTKQKIIDGFELDNYNYVFDTENQVNWKDMTDHPDKYEWPAAIWCDGQDIKMHTQAELEAVVDQFRVHKYNCLKDDKLKQAEVMTCKTIEELEAIEI